MEIRSGAVNFANYRHIIFLIRGGLLLISRVQFLKKKISSAVKVARLSKCRTDEAADEYSRRFTFISSLDNGRPM